MRVLILSANTGGGHNSAAKAVGEAFRRLGHEYEITDALSFLSETVSEVLSKGHNNLYRYLPGLFGVGYRFAENHSPRLLYESMAPGAKRLSQFIKNGDFDVAVCTHVFAAMMITEGYKKYDLHIPQYFVSTDYTCYPGVSTVDVEAVFMPAEGLRQEFLDGGVQEERLVAINGIPISHIFSVPPLQEEARHRLGLPQEGRVVLLCCGSMGCGNMHSVAPDFVRQLPEDVTFVVICGHNVRAYQQLTEMALERTVVVGFTNQIVDYMAAADICVSKPGGLSTTELLSVKVPMVLLLAVPGCESRNMDFLVGQKLAVRADDWDEAVTATVRLLCEPDELKALQDRLEETDFSRGADTVATYVTKRYEQK
ncbi:MAG: hypothetical protein IJ518_02095 [Clostridia bacterium]|nr:hypothetical protein [Clostridia bacterium]